MGAITPEGYIKGSAGNTALMALCKEGKDRKLFTPQQADLLVPIVEPRPITLSGDWRAAKLRLDATVREVVYAKSTAIPQCNCSYGSICSCWNCAFKIQGGPGEEFVICSYDEQCGCFIAFECDGLCDWIGGKPAQKPQPAPSQKPESAPLR